MEIGIIGTGNIGGTLARKLIAAGHQVRVANSKGIHGVQSFADEIGATAVDVYGAVKGVDAIILSIPLPALASLPKGFFDDLPETVPLIDTSNYYPGLRDPHIPEIDGGMTESVWVSQQLSHPVIKAFNNILAWSLAELGTPKGSTSRLAIAVAGDNAALKQIVMNLVNDTGFDAVDAGSLEESWRQQPSTPAYCCDYDVETMKKGLAAAVKGEAAAKRDRLPELFGKLGANPTHEDIVAMNRSLNLNPTADD
ncbi:3-hydroxyisobutyrate dehydrogenase [Pectobacterium wasabiae]|uniref:3-hydroxyisobutyrate dehydrogenase n=2 Tax=Pectobacterium wasabiae TaxID=55208 RepID=A0AAW3EM02_9GAMM|nr:3-hydroxyisobutyrate dehydrogenase [Pectobacterium wasabiae CFBP 3304]EJS95111.1 NADP oxidoreductase coenzyme F420-dependent [Pectobacterium wasabiae CFBP 3304]KFX08070.1 3-hydroxyisobutyrate dehydrogenase [Pectobacterium wasabiae]KGA30705.1 3-hydroxyisobutyrate dehydrogenase [Pectobacterium wasabiae]